MPCWYYAKKELKNTPSALENIDFETEMRYRKEGARFIIDTGSKMDLGYNTTATGVVYFHRFYMFHSFRQFPRYVTACCCLFLAGKVEETPKKCKDIIKTARSLLSDQKFATFGDDPKEEVMTLERILLQTIKFDLQVEHPYSYLLRYAKCLKGDKVKLQKMVQMAWTFVNDSLCTTLALQWEPEIIAVALMYLAGKLSQFEVLDWAGRTSKHLRWWDMFVEDVTMDLLEDICHQVLDLYSQTAPPTTPDSPPLIPRPGGGGTPSNTIRPTNGNQQQPADGSVPPVTGDLALMTSATAAAVAASVAMQQQQHVATPPPSVVVHPGDLGGVYGYTATLPPPTSYNTDLHGVAPVAVYPGAPPPTLHSAPPPNSHIVGPPPSMAAYHHHPVGFGYGPPPPAGGPVVTSSVVLQQPPPPLLPPPGGPPTQGFYNPPPPGGGGVHRTGYFK